MSTWTPNYTKLLISIKKEKQANFTSGKMRKKEAWSTVAEAFNATDGVVVRVTSEQCTNKWKKLEEKFKKTDEHNAKTGKHVNFTKSYPTAWGTTPKLFQLLQCPRLNQWHQPTSVKKQALLMIATRNLPLSIPLHQRKEEKKPQKRERGRSRQLPK